MSIKLENKIYPLYSDLMFKYIFGYQKNAKFTASLLESFLGYEVGSLKNIKIINSVKLDNKTINEKKFETDVLVKLPNGELINIEMYTKFDRNAEIKSVMYITSIFASSLEAAKDYNSAKSVTQINFVKDNKKEEMIKEYLLINQNNIKDKMIPKLFQIFVINVDSKENVRYNKENRIFYLWIKLLNADTEEIERIAKENKIMEEVVQEMRIFSGKKKVQDYHATEVMKISQHNSELKRVKEEAEQNYHAQEVLIRSQHNSELKRVKEEAVRKMLLKGFNDLDIIEITNISDEDLNEIKSKMREA